MKKSKVGHGEWTWSLPQGYFFKKKIVSLFFSFPPKIPQYNYDANHPELAAVSKVKGSVSH